MKFPKLTPRVKKLLLLGSIAALLGGILCALAYHGIGVPCLFYQITKLQCPGCGNSRAILALLRLDIRAALGYNLMLPLELFYLSWVIFHCCRSYLKDGRFRYQPPKLWLDIALLVILILWGILRNML